MKRFSSAKSIVLFLLLWLFTGFALGTATLLGPVRWVVSEARDRGFSEGIENALVIVLIALLVVVSLGLARAATFRVLKTETPAVRWGLPTGMAALAAAALALLLNPKVLNGATGPTTDTTNATFTFGSYPTHAELRQLKREGYAGVISLLHPAVTPFEPKLLRDEQAAGRAVGIAIISIPMLPWISQNGEALERIRAIAENPKGRYYVHCYLGKDRVNVVKRLVSQHANTHDSEPTDARSLADVAAFERGPVVELSQGVYLTPFPTDEEYMGYVVAAGVKQVVSLMDTTDAEALERVRTERHLLSTYRIPLREFPVLDATTEAQLQPLFRALATMPRPVVIHRFFSDHDIEKRFVDAYRKSVRPPA